MSLLKDLPIFKGLEPAELDAFLAVVEEREVDHGAVLFEQGDEADAVYVIKRGSVRIVRRQGSVERELAVLFNGDFFGEMGVMRSAPRSAAAVVEGNAVLLVIRRQDFTQLLATHPGISHLVMSTMIARFKEESFVDEKPVRPIEPPQAMPVTPAPAREESPPAVALAPPAPAPGANVLIGVFSGTGGVGNSFVTANLAGAIRALTGARVLVMDLDLMFGDQGAIFGLDQGTTVSDIIPEGDEAVDPQDLFDVIQPTKAEVDVLLAPSEPEHADLLIPGFIITCLELLRPRYNYILCDTARLIQDFSLCLLEMVQIPIYVMSPEVIAVKNAGRWLRVMDKIGMPTERVQLLFNKCEELDETTVEFLEKTFKKKALGRLSLDTRAARESMNKAELLVLSQPDHPLSREIRRVAGAITGIEVEATEAKSFWRRLIAV